MISVEKDQRSRHIASGIGTVRLYEDGIVEGGRLFFGRKAVFKLRFTNNLFSVPDVLTQLWAQHARAVDVRIRGREDTDEFKRLVADHAKYVCDKKVKHMSEATKKGVKSGRSK